jgi:hypothetical protein
VTARRRPPGADVTGSRLYFAALARRGRLRHLPRGRPGVPGRRLWRLRRGRGGLSVAAGTAPPGPRGRGAAGALCPRRPATDDQDLRSGSGPVALAGGRSLGVGRPQGPQYSSRSARRNPSRGARGAQGNAEVVFQPILTSETREAPHVRSVARAP